MSYARHVTRQRTALIESQAARGALAAAAGDVLGIYQRHPLPVLAGATGAGFVLARLQVGGRAVRAGMRIASGPAWRVLRQFIAAA